MPSPVSHPPARPTLAERTDPAQEEALAAYWTAFVDGGRGAARHVLTHARATWAAVRAIAGLPVLEAAPSGSSGGEAVRAVLATRASYGVPARLLGTAVLEVPADPADHLEGRRARTLRRKIRAAEKRDLKVEAVETDDERRTLLALADHAERSHPDASYRVPAPDNHDLLQHELWLTVRDGTGAPLLLAVAPHDGEFAVLRYFRTLGAGDAQSDARYLATSALVEALSRRGVRYLLDTATPPEQTNGLRHFQRMVGFRYARVRLHRSTRR